MRRRRRISRLVFFFPHFPLPLSSFLDSRVVYLFNYYYYYGKYIYRNSQVTWRSSTFFIFYFLIFFKKKIVDLGLRYSHPNLPVTSLFLDYVIVLHTVLLLLSMDGWMNGCMIWEGFIQGTVGSPWFSRHTVPYRSVAWLLSVRRSLSCLVIEPHYGTVSWLIRLQKAIPRYPDIIWQPPSLPPSLPSICLEYR